MAKPFQLGAILQRQGAITEEQLDAALEYHRQHHCRFGQALLTLGFCTEAQLGRAFAEQLGMGFVDLEETPPTRNALQLMPQGFARQHGVIPVSKENGTLVVAVRNPFDYRLDGIIRDAVSVPVVLACAVGAQIDQALSQYDQLMSWQSVTGASALSSSVRTAVRNAGGLQPITLVRGPELQSGENIEHLLQDHLDSGGEEIHFEIEAHSITIRGYVAGRLTRLGTVPRSTSRVVISRPTNGGTTAFCKVRMV